MESCFIACYITKYGFFIENIFNKFIGLRLEEERDIKSVKIFLVSIPWKITQDKWQQ